MSTTASDRLPRKPNRSHRRLVLLTVFLVAPCVLILFAYFSTRIAGGMRLDQAIAEADAHDPGWRFEELEANRRPYPAPEKNGIDHVLRVRAAMPKSNWPEWPFPQFSKDKGYLIELRQAMDKSLEPDRMAPTLLNEEQERVMRAEAQRAQSAIELARQMPQYPYGRYPVKWTKDFVSTLIPHVQEVRLVGRLLEVDARLHAQDQDLEGALLDVKAILFASRAIGDEQCLISQLVRMAVDAMAVRALEQVLASGVPSGASLLDLQKELEEQAKTPYFLVGLRAERAGWNYVFENVETGVIPFAMFRRIMMGLSRNPRSENVWTRDLETLRMYANIRGERAQFLHLLNQVTELAKLPPWESIPAIEDLLKNFYKNPPAWSELLFSFDKLSQADARSKAYLETAYTAVAIERFRQVKNRWPEKLNELVPDFLSGVPLDPFDGKPLRLVRKGPALIVYSVSADKEDNGGTFLVNPTQPGSDIGFVLHDLAHRRQPAMPFEFPPKPWSGDNESQAGPEKP